MARKRGSRAATTSRRGECVGEQRPDREQEQGLGHVSCQPQHEQCDGRPGEDCEREAATPHPPGDHTAVESPSLFLRRRVFKDISILSCH